MLSILYVSLAFLAIAQSEAPLHEENNAQQLIRVLPNQESAMFERALAINGLPSDYRLESGVSDDVKGSDHYEIFVSDIQDEPVNLVELIRTLNNEKKQ